MIRIGIVRGGEQRYEQSLKSGAYLLRSLPRDTYSLVDIFVDRSGTWHIGGLPASHQKIANAVDVIWNTIGGEHARIFEVLGIPVLGHATVHAALASDHSLMMNRLFDAGIRTPRSFTISWTYGNADEVAEAVALTFRTFAPPWNVRAISLGRANPNAIRCATRDELAAVFAEMANAGVPVFIEEVIMGRKLAILTIPGFRTQNVYASLPLDVRNPERRPVGEKNTDLAALAAQAHLAAGIGSYAQVHLAITPRGQAVVLGVEIEPLLHEDSIGHHALGHVGSSIPEFFEHLLRIQRGE